MRGFHSDLVDELPSWRPRVANTPRRAAFASSSASFFSSAVSRSVVSFPFSRSNDAARSSSSLLSNARWRCARYRSSFCLSSSALLSALMLVDAMKRVRAYAATSASAIETMRATSASMPNIVVVTVVDDDDESLHGVGK